MTIKFATKLTLTVLTTLIVFVGAAPETQSAEPEIKACSPEALHKIDATKTLSDYDIVIQVCTEVIVAALIMRAVTHESKGMYDEALADRSEIIKNAPTAGYYRDRGVLYNQRFHRCDLAIADFNRAIEIDGEFVFGYLGLGVCYFKMGDKSKSIDAFRKVYSKTSASDPLHDNARASLKQLGALPLEDIIPPLEGATPGTDLLSPPAGNAPYNFCKEIPSSSLCQKK